MVINLKLREEALIAKCLGRRICSDCGGNYNVACIDIKGEDGSPRMYMPPLLPPPNCESKLITRSDDTEEVVKERLRVYNEKVKLHFLKSLTSCIFLWMRFFMFLLRFVLKQKLINHHAEGDYTSEVIEKHLIK